MIISLFNLEEYLMRKSDSFQEQQGYFTFVQNTDAVDYLELAYVQALSIKCTQKINSYAIAVDQQTKELINEQHRQVFDYIIDIRDDHNDSSSVWKLANEWQAWWLTPFKETVKLEADMLFTRNIDHWWTGLRHQEVCLTSQIRTYENTVSNCRIYRRVFDDNNLPDVYNGFMYFRYGQTSLEFFKLAREIYQHWPLFRDQLLKNCREETPSTDLVYAIAAQLIGPERCTLPGLDYPSFVHMKGSVNGLNINSDWTKTYYAQLDDQLNLTVGFNRQVYPFHYYQKHFINDDIKHRFEQCYNRIKLGTESE